MVKFQGSVNEFKFENAIEYVLDKVGGFSEGLNDENGTTNFGISVRYLQNLNGEKLKKYGIFDKVTNFTIEKLTLEQAKLIYFCEFWEGQRFDEIYNQDLCNYIFDMCVDMGHFTAIKIVQRAVNCWQQERNFITVNGILDDILIDEINSYNQNDILDLIVMGRESHYYCLATQSVRNARNLEKWLNRAYAIWEF